MVQLSVYTRLLRTPGVNTCCQPILIFSSSNTPISVVIDGPIFEPFEIVISARNFVFTQAGSGRGGGLIILDDIEYIGKVCQRGVYDSRGEVF